MNNRLLLLIMVATTINMGVMIHSRVRHEPYTPRKEPELMAIICGLPDEEHDIETCSNTYHTIALGRNWKKFLREQKELTTDQHEKENHEH